MWSRPVTDLQYGGGGDGVRRSLQSAAAQHSATATTRISTRSRQCNGDALRHLPRSPRVTTHTIIYKMGHFILSSQHPFKTFNDPHYDILKMLCFKTRGKSHATCNSEIVIKTAKITNTFKMKRCKISYAQIY